MPLETDLVSNYLKVWARLEAQIIPWKHEPVADHCSYRCIACASVFNSSIQQRVATPKKRRKNRRKKRQGPTQYQRKEKRGKRRRKIKGRKKAFGACPYLCLSFDRMSSFMRFSMLSAQLLKRQRDKGTFLPRVLSFDSESESLSYEGASHTQWHRCTKGKNCLKSTQSTKWANTWTLWPWFWLI